MSLHGSLIGAESTRHFAHFADAGRFTFNVKGAAAQAMSAIIGAVSYEDRETDTGLVRIALRTVMITNDPTSNYGGIAAPKLNSTATVDGESWAVAGITTVDGVHALHLEAPAAGEMLRSSYYGDR